MNRAPVLIMAGGTGGHVFPALAVARALRQRDEQIVWLGTEAGFEAQLVPREGFPMEWIRVRGLRRKGALAWLRAPFVIAVAVLDAAGVLRRRRPKVVLGMGGYTAGPGALAAWLLRYPVVIHEQNAVAGLTNRLLAGLAREVLEAFPGSFSSRRKTRVTGNPVRDDIAALPAPELRLAGRTGPLRVLVIGGSQGARALNQAVPAAIARLPAIVRPEVWHQTGRNNLDATQAAYNESGAAGRVEPFIDDMASAYAWADVVVARAGALTVAELAATGVGSILVPYPSAVDDHQTRNARYLVDAGAAVLLPESRLTPAALAAELALLANDRNLVVDRARRARSRATPGATRDIVEACLRAGAH